MRRAAALSLAGVLAACTAVPPPKVIHEDRSLSVRLIADGRAGAPHGHPVHLTPGQMTRILGGLRVLKFSGAPPEDLPAEQREGSAVFSREEIRAMTPYLIQAFDQASPSQLIGFHLAVGPPADPATRPVVTSGGFFVQNDHLYVILANYRTKPFGNAYEGSAISEIDLRSDPLVPIMRGGYTLGFSPSTATVGAADRGAGWNFVEEQKVIVIDLARMPARGME